jgi:hypothetical protein
MGDRDRNALELIYSNAFEEVKNNRDELVPPYSK